ncbi:TMV resistance protein N-like [Bidens hawaiensis]|uniref:TMV resistance protein N-like n=1 Tax=Bidens hawaiensis TaxID=980011 RepID=UPI00404AD078
MASSSSSPVQKRFKYDVFVSFRGDDTRKTFVDHLYHALDHRGIITYKDDESYKDYESLPKRRKIGDELMESIENSKFHIIVFSKNYASSSWCLDELVKIMESQKTMEHTAIPVFYDVEPTEVRYQSGAVGEALAKVGNQGAVWRWSEALKEAASLAGWELNNTRLEAKVVNNIAEYISLKPYFNKSSVDGNLIGMETRLKDMDLSLEVGLDDVRMIGITGIGGGGKTTLSRAVFDHVSNYFEGFCFVENIREVSKGSVSGLRGLQKQVLSDVLNDQSIDVKNVFDGKNKMKRMMPSRKALVVLDDVDDIYQLEALVGELTWFKPGSRIIITTRDRQVLVAHGVSIIHDVNLLSEEEAICLFSRYAFGGEISIKGYEKLSRKVVHYAAGLPFTIKVLGSHLCDRSELEWIDAINRLKDIPLKETLVKLELSYNSLEDDEKEIFLDVVCILKGKTKDKAIRILESCGFHAQIGLRVLEQKSLITFSKYGDYLGFHDHIEEMGRNIVHRLHPHEPNKHTRLWIKEEIEDILGNESGTEATRSIKLEYSDLHPLIIMRGLRKMKNLRFLYVDDECREWKIDQVGEYLPNTLQSLHWPQYPFYCLPKSFQAKKLVNLEMVGSNISQIWEGGERKVFNKLGFLDLRWSKLETFDLGITPHLETLDLDGCKNFLELNMLYECPNLKLINLSGSKLSSLNLGLTPYLERLYLEECNDFVELQLPIECPNLKFLNLSGSKVSNLSLRLTPNLEMLDLRGCDNFVELCMPVKCPKLNFLNLNGSNVSILNLWMTPNLEMLDLGGCMDFVELHLPVKLPYLKFLHLGGSKLSNLKLGLTTLLEKLESLEKLTLSIEDIERLPDSICMLKRLKYLELKSCRRLKKLPKNIGRLECLEELNLTDCILLRDIPNSFCKMKSLKFLHLPYCTQVERLPEELGSLECLTELNIVGTGIDSLPHSIFKLKGLRVIGSRWQLESYGLISLKEISTYTASCYI